ncbi:hypothetical protein C8A05DRAFT_14340 [Staphylotrichum tortipilum]|uniref:Uncharacterized protein n=1 Tax=Staphylotrichum tortipilum TaxID=2831512 RepID=A0AAN6MNN4_9PEZI|nr:hypothetical protein C8A05DRAFT_14340 [Staphylotrichum longicolle]
MNRQHQKALPSLPTDARPHPPDPLPCSGTFTNQYRLRCSHKLLDMMKRKEPITKEYIHPRWWLRQPLNLADALLNIKDPDVVKTLRGRPKNKNIPYHGNEPPSSAEASRLSSAPQPKLPRRAANRAPRPVRQSLRRNRSEFEYDDDNDDKLALLAPTQQGTQEEIVVATGFDAPAAKRRGGRRAVATPSSTAPANL